MSADRKQDLETAVTGRDVEKSKDISTSTIDQPQLTAAVSNGEPYSVYAKKQKIWIIFTASVASFFSPMGANIYLPAINSVAKDLHVSSAKINYTLSAYLVR